MFKVWRSEKKRIKAVFMLQFQATQVPQVKGNKLTISLVPEDVGKPTVRLEKAPIRDGTCSWENEIYETVKLLKETKTGMVNNKIYRFIVSSGSSKANYLGEVSINFAHFLEVAGPSVVSLPLANSKSGAILHVKIQNMNGAADQRISSEIEGCDNLKTTSLDRSLNYQTRKADADEDSNRTLAEDEQINKFLSREPKESSADVTLENSITSQDRTLRWNSMPHKTTVDAVSKESAHVHRRSDTVWSISSLSEGSMAESTNSPEDNILTYRLQEASDRSTEIHGNETLILERKAEVAELELQSLRKQIVKETRRGQDLLRHVVSLKEESDELRSENEQLKSLQKYVDDEAEASNQLQMESESLRSILEEIKEELNHEKDLNTTLRVQLQKTEDSNSELILAVRDLENMLEVKNREISNLSSSISASQNAEKVIEDTMNNHAREVDLLKQTITGLYAEIELYRKDKEELKTHMEQLIVDYDVLKQENHDISASLRKNQTEQMNMQNQCSESSAATKAFKIQVERLEKEVHKQATELSESSAIINDLETQVNNLKKEMDKQAQCFEDDLETMTRVKIEQEQRAIQAEEALRKTRRNNATSAEQLQEEVKKISAEMAAKFDANEKQAMESVSEANNLRLQNRALEEMLQKANVELGLIKDQYDEKVQELGLIKDQYDERVQELANQTGMRAKQLEQMSQELVDKCVQVKNLKERKEKMHEMFTSDIKKLRGEIEGLKTEKNSFSEEAAKNLKQHVMLEKENQRQKELAITHEKKELKGHNEQDTYPDVEQKTFEDKSSAEKEEGKIPEDVTINTTDTRSEMRRAEGMYKPNDIDSVSVKRVHTHSEKKLEVSTFHDGDDDDHTVVLSDVAILKESTKHMERELKEMQERYSALSLKFAEVEGERQQLVMNVRNLKNGKKN